MSYHGNAIAIVKLEVRNGCVNVCHVGRWYSFAENEARCSGGTDIERELQDRKTYSDKLKTTSMIYQEDEESIRQST